MPDINVVDIDNKSAGNISLPDEFFGIKDRDSLLHEAVVNYLANQRQGTHSTKGRSDVSGGGKKPYKQKGTGRARAGTLRSPVWRGGGTVFGPHPRDYGYTIPRRARRLALYAAISARIAEGDVVVVKALDMEKPKTKQMVKVLEGLEVSGVSLLVVLSDLDRNVALSVRNIPGVRIRVASDLNVYDVLAHRKVLCTKAALEALKEKSKEVEGAES